MRGWALVALPAGLTAAVTAVLMWWWWWRQLGGAMPASSPGPRQRGSGPGVWSLLTGLALMFSGWNLGVRHGDHVLGVVGVVLGAISATLGVGGLLAERRWHRH